MQRTDPRRPFSAERRRRQPLNGQRIEGANGGRAPLDHVLGSIARIEVLLGLPGAAANPGGQPPTAAPRRRYSVERHRIEAEESGAVERLDLIRQALEAPPPANGAAAPAVGEADPTDHGDDRWGADVTAETRERRLHETQVQIALIRSDAHAGVGLEAAAAETAAIVETTEAAANVILDSVEHIERVMEQIRVTSKDVSVHERLDEIQQSASRIVAATNFQDLTGQRASKVRKTLEFVDRRVAQITEIWGEAAFEGIALPPPEDPDPDRDSLHGPQAEGEGLSQDDIDALFD